MENYEQNRATFFELTMSQPPEDAAAIDRTPNSFATAVSELNNEDTGARGAAGSDKNSGLYY